jgi:Protein of unknown function (DUF2786)
VDYQSVITKLEAKAQNPAVTPEEKAALNRKIKELREKHNITTTVRIPPYMMEAWAEGFVERHNPWRQPKPPADIVEEDYRYDNEEGDW